MSYWFSSRNFLRGGGGGEAISIVLGPSFRDCKSLQGGQKAWGGCPLPILEERHQRFNPISTGLFCLVVSLGGGCFPPPFHNSFVFKVRLLKFCTELLSDRMNNLLWKKSESNQQWRHYDVTVTSYFSQVSINSAKKSLFWNSCCFSIFHSILLKFGRNILNT